MKVQTSGRLLTVAAIINLFIGTTLSQNATPHGAEAALPLGKEQPALSTTINGPSSLAYSNGRLYVMETAGMGILSLDVRRESAKVILVPPIDPYTHDNNALGSPFALAVSQTEHIFVADVAGKLAEVNPNEHSASIRRTGLLEKFPQVHAMAVDPSNGTILLTDRHALLRWTPGTNELTKLGGSSYSSGFSGDSGPAKDATFNWPQGLAVDIQGNIFVADTENCRIREIGEKTGIIVTIAGGARCDSIGDGGPAKAALLNTPRAVVVDSHNSVFFSEPCRVRRIDSEGTISTYAGTSECGFSGDGGLATNAKLKADGLAIDESGNLYISDYSHNRIRRVDARTHHITTLAGSGLPDRGDVLM